MSTSSRFFQVFALVLCAVSVGLAGCGSDDDTKSESSGDQAGATSVVGVAVAYKPESDYNGNLDQFVSAASSYGVGVSPQLQKGGPYTVFAPTTEAFFESMSNEQFEKLAEPDGQKQLKEIVQYNVVEGEFKVADLKDGQKLKTLQGGELTVKIDGGTVTLVGAENSAKVVDSDLQANNGVVHVTDKLLLPFPVDEVK
jgi:uncharacterized surface protein with fasciclin (FAS1) repeats